MKNTISRISRIIVAIAMILAIGIAFVPLMGESVFAAETTPEPTPVFNKSDTVKNFRVSAVTYNSVTMTWDAYSCASGYEIYKASKKSGKYKRIKRTGATAYKRTKLTTNKTCYYKIRAYVKSGTKYSYCKFSGALAGKPTLAAPTVKYSAVVDYLTVSWNGISGASGYRLYKASSSNGKYKLIKTTKAKSYTDKAVSRNATYYYKVRAYRNSNGKKYGRYSAAIPASTAPAQVTNVNASSDEGGINVSWTGVPYASGYDIYRGESENGSYVMAGTSTTNSYLDSGVESGNTYFYKVRAYRNQGAVKSAGDFSIVGPNREKVVSTAYGWLGCKESNKSNKPIIDLYNSKKGTSYNYKTPWCAIFVSAVAYKSGYSKYIVTGSYCPSIINAYKSGKSGYYSYGKGSSYVPKPGDVIFFDWNRNGVPDHTGMVAAVDGSYVRTIEGNYTVNGTDAVATRAFNVGWSLVQGYGLPAYGNAGGIVYTATEAEIGSIDMLEDGLEAEPEGTSELGSEVNKAETNIEIAAESTETESQYDLMIKIIEEAKAAAKPEAADCTESQYYAALINELCQNEGLSASVVSAENSSGNLNSWVEVILDGKWYRVDASQDECVPENFVPEATDIVE